MPEDHLLVDAILHGDACAESRFVAEYQPVFERTFLRITGNRHLAEEDLVQDMFEAVFAADCDKLRRWQGRSTLKTYLLKVAQNLALDRTRSRLCRPLGETEFQEEQGREPPKTSPGTIGANAEAAKEGEAICSGNAGSEATGSGKEATNEFSTANVDGTTPDLSFYELFLAKVLPICSGTAHTPDELVALLGLHKTQLNIWLKQAVSDGKLEKLNRPVRYQATGDHQATLDL